MTRDTLPGEITGPERHIYMAAADRARKTYRRKYGAAVTMSLAERRAWNTTHADGLATAAGRAGLAAVRKVYRARITHLEDMTRPDRVGGPVDGRFLAILERDAAHAAARLEILATIGATSGRKTARRKVPAAAVAAPAAAPRVRKTSKLEPCTGHADYWQNLTPARRFQNAVEGGNRTACTGGECVLTPGTDRYTADLAAGGPVTLAALNGAPVPAPVPADDMWAPRVTHASYSRTVGAVTDTGPACQHVDDIVTREDLEILPAMTCPECVALVAALPDTAPSAAVPADTFGSLHAVYTWRNGAAVTSGPACQHVDDIATRADVDGSGPVTCAACVTLLESLPAAPVPARFVCKSCPGETPAGIGYVCHTFGPIPAPSPDCVGVHADTPAPVTVPADMPRQTRAARRASRRELADTLRAVGLRPAGDVWTLARAGHEPADIVRHMAEGSDLAAMVRDLETVTR